MPGKMLNSRSSVLGLDMNPDSPMPLTLSQTDIELLDKESNKCKKEEMVEYLLYASVSPAPGMAPAHWVRRSICTICQVRVRGVCSYIRKPLRCWYT